MMRNLLPSAMQRAVAFCQVIEHRPGNARTHKVSSKHIVDMFQPVVEEYQATEGTASSVVCEAMHIDGTMNATQKETKLNWLKAEIPDNHCRVLSNVRCLSEGVDVPALDAVLFLTPRNSQVDVVQSVGTGDAQCARQDPRLCDPAGRDPRPVWSLIQR